MTEYSKMRPFSKRFPKGVYSGNKEVDLKGLQDKIDSMVKKGYSSGHKPDKIISDVHSMLRKKLGKGQYRTGDGHKVDLIMFATGYANERMMQGQKASDKKDMHELINKAVDKIFGPEQKDEE
jgi:hypothetical protein